MAELLGRLSVCHCRALRSTVQAPLRRCERGLEIPDTHCRPAGQYALTVPCSRIRQNSGDPWAGRRSARSLATSATSETCVSPHSCAKQVRWPTVAHPASTYLAGVLHPLLAGTLQLQLSDSQQILLGQRGAVERSHVLLHVRQLARPANDRRDALDLKNVLDRQLRQRSVGAGKWA